MLVGKVTHTGLARRLADPLPCLCGSWLARMLLTSLNDPAVADLKAMVPDASPAQVDLDHGRSMDCVTDGWRGWPHRPVYEEPAVWPLIAIGVGSVALMLAALGYLLCCRKGSSAKGGPSETTPLSAPLGKG